MPNELSWRGRGLGALVLAIITLGIFKSVYKRLSWPFRSLFLWSLSTVYAFLLSLALMGLIASELEVVARHFSGLSRLLRSSELGLLLFSAIFGACWLSFWSSLGWYFEEPGFWERAQRLSQRVGHGSSQLGQWLRSCVPSRAPLTPKKPWRPWA